MNLKTIAKDSRSYIKISLLFFVLVFAIETLMLAYWHFILEPRIRLEADANAQIIAESQGRLISKSLLSNQGYLQLNTVNDIVDNTLLLKDPLLNEPFFIGISLELDHDALGDQLINGDSWATDEITSLSRGNTLCLHCFAIEIGLYSHISNELIGLAQFQVNDAIFQKFKSDIQNKLFVEAIIVLIIAILVWYAAIHLIKQLQVQISVREKVEVKLRQAIQQTEAASDAKSQFLANMSHEIRTPLNAIVGMGYLVLKGDLSEKQRDYLRKMDSSAKMLLSLINDILDFSKSESGKLELEHSHFVLDDVLDNLKKLLSSKAEEKGIDLIFAVTNQVPQNLMGDALRLGQILLNLCNNALKFTHQGSIIISIEKVEQNDKLVTLKFCVTDTGIGISVEQQQKLFQSFSQVDSSTTRKYGGTGLGLAISKQLTELMNGRIWVESQPGLGSSFSFTAEFELGKQISKLKHLPSELQNMSVLVIDDNLLTLDIYTSMLEDFSFEVHSATNAECGIQTVIEMDEKNTPIHLILMDWRLPGIDGIEAARQIKSNLRLSSIPNIILISASNNEEVINSAKDILDAFLPKPLTHSYLYDSIVTLYAQSVEHAPENKLFHQEHGDEEVVDTPFWPNAKILLVEDNVINQEVATAIMADTQMKIEIANNGKEAIQKIYQCQYDLVLMDIQMPEMDGLSATRELRKNISSKQLPIIAMTAHAMQKDKDECIDAGMDDYLAKPFVVDELFATLKKWLPTQSVESLSHEENSLNKATQSQPNSNSNEPAQRSTVSSENRSMENSQIEQYAGLDMQDAQRRFKGKKELFVRLLRSFLDSKSEHLEQVKQMLKENNWSEAGKIIHGLKGTSGNLCAITFYQTAIELEGCIANENKIQANLYLQQMINAFRELKNSVDKLEQSIDNNQEQSNTLVHPTLDGKAIHAILDELKELIEGNNLRARDVVKKLNALLGDTLYAEEVKHLNDYLERLDFEQALGALEKITQSINPNV